MKIMHLSAAQGWRGGEQQLAYLAMELKTMNVQQYVVCPENSAIQTFCQKNQILYFTYQKKSSFSFRTAKILRNICVQVQPDIIHTHDSHAHTFAVLADVFFGNRIPVFVSRRVDFLVGRNLFSKLKYNHRRVKFIICVSKAIALLTAPSIKDKAKLRVIYDGIDAKRFDPPMQNPTNIPSMFQDKKGIFIGNVAAIAPHKDYFTFVDTAKILIEEGLNARFFIIGDGPLRHEIEAYIQKQQMTEHIVLTGFLDNIPQILPLLDIFLITSKTEGLGSSILDAFAVGVPVVATRAGGIPEIVIDHQTGLLAPVQNPRMLANRIIELINDPELQSRIISGAKQVLPEFSCHNMALKTRALYQEMLERSTLL